jgi:hypothetical protein
MKFEQVSGFLPSPEKNPKLCLKRKEKVQGLIKNV